ncbi:MAG: iron ABC transporter permease [Candidatus Terraquivivens tikiterensis]|uniref:Iron ABC transporter permease n=1 Tax=Candidatus Terraquivivens tikiterensis TaxID=1980982 RepID=A0A2R7YC00_9ARCH|nr:MAG: iron ABC transporter permease [Candidatus Terraquivivens tikiterensis]
MAVKETKGKELYKKIVWRKLVLVISLAVTCALTLLLDISTGPSQLSLFEVFSTIISPNHSDPVTHTIIWTIRLPMALMAIVVGAALGVAGAEMQTILNNPLASPYTLGVSAGAGFGAALAIVLGAGVIPYIGEFVTSINAFIFSLLTCLLIYLIAKAGRMAAETMILAGIAVTLLFHSLLALLEYIASPEALQAIVFWLFGSLTKATLLKVGITSVGLLAVVAFLSTRVWRLTALRLGDEKAKSLGINVEKLRLEVFICVSLLTAVAVCFVGTIGFIGLVGPHIARMCVGEEQRFFLPMSLLGGAVTLSAASVISKLVVPGIYFPIGIITSLIGLPFFLSIILMKRRGYW